jgi:DNA-nicking Smr family endonuclease
MGKRGSEGGGSPEGEFHNRPLKALASLKAQLAKSEEEEKKRKQEPPPPPPPPKPLPREEAEERALARAMADVVPLTDRDRVTKGRKAAQPRTVDEAAAVDAYLRDLVDGAIPFDIADTDEYIEGAVQGFDHKVLRQLRRGEFALQGHLDLHGLNRDEARAAVARFINQAAGEGKRCVLIVHGRGLRSKDQIPVLKEKLKAWLTRGSIGTKVLAFATARPYDGGAGAAYVLLRR